MADNDRPNKPIDVLLYALHWLAFTVAAVCVLSASVVAASAQGVGNGPTAMWEVHPRVAAPVTAVPRVSELCPPTYGNYPCAVTTPRIEADGTTIMPPLITYNGTMTTQPYVTSFNPLCPPDYVLVAVSRSTYKCAKDLVDPQ